MRNASLPINRHLSLLSALRYYLFTYLMQSVTMIHVVTAPVSHFISFILPSSHSQIILILYWMTTILLDRCLSPCSVHLCWSCLSSSNLCSISFRFIYTPRPHLLFCTADRFTSCLRICLDVCQLGRTAVFMF